MPVSRRSAKLSGVAWSKGAAYVRRLRRNGIGGEVEDGKPKLFWTPEHSLYWDGKEDCRVIWGLADRAEARAICVLKSVEFCDDSPALRHRETRKGT